MHIQTLGDAARVVGRDSIMFSYPDRTVVTVGEMIDLHGEDAEYNAVLRDIVIAANDS